MDFEIDQACFLAALNLANSVADRRGTMPILAHVLLKAEDARVICCATDMTISLTESIDAEVAEPGSLSLGVQHLAGVLKTLPAGGVRVRGLDNHWAEITAGRSQFKIMGKSDADYPELPSTRGLEWTMVPVHQLGDLLHKTLFSVSSDEARVNLNGAFFESDGATATMVSTDGHRLTKFSLAFAGPVLDEGVIIPRKGMIELRRVLDRLHGEVGLAIADQYLHLRSDRLTLSVKLNAVTFPPYDQVIPKKHKRRATIDREALIGVLRSAAVTAPEKTATVRLHLEADVLALTADNPDVGVSHLELGVDYSHDPLTAGFNAHYLIEALEVIDTASVHLDFQGELDPCVLRPVDGPQFLAVVMPMRI